MSELRGAGWRVVESQIVVDTQHMRLRCDSIELPDGGRVDNYYVRESHGFSVILAVTPEDRVVLVRQYKHGIGECLLELPAGAIDPDETPLQCAERELVEETGYVGDPPEHLGSFVYDPTSSNTRYHLYLVRNARPLQAQRLDSTEQIELQLASFEELRRFVRDGTIVVGAQVASIYYALDRLGRL